MSFSKLKNTFQPYTMVILLLIIAYVTSGYPFSTRYVGMKMHFPAIHEAFRWGTLLLLVVAVVAVLVRYFVAKKV